LAAPLSRLLESAWERMHWWVGVMAVLYALSGITVVKPAEVAVVLRWGRLVGATPVLQQHGPGLLIAFPRPIDEVVRVETRRISELRISTLATAGEWTDYNSLDPVTSGYALTGDRNVVQAEMIARYRVKDPVAWAFYSPDEEDVLRVEVTAMMVRSLGEMVVDRVLSEGRKDLVATAMERAQAGLDAVHSGLELSSLELVRLAPPTALVSAFDEVQSAFIGAETRKKEALAFAQQAIPDAQAAADRAVQGARAAAAGDAARAKGEAEAFLALAREYRANPAVVRERLYRDAIERAIAGAAVTRWVPPPSRDGRYQGLRISIPPQPTGSSQWAPPSQIDDLGEDE
jgi:membrane protease subunit HflK